MKVMKLILPLILSFIIILSAIPQTGYLVTYAEENEELAKKAEALINVATDLVAHLEIVVNNTKFTADIVVKITANITELKNLLKEAKVLFNEGKYEDAIKLAKEIIEKARKVYAQILEVKKVSEAIEEEVKKCEEKGRKERFEKVAKVLERVAKKINATHVRPLLEAIKERLKKGNLTGLGKKISEVARSIRAKVLKERVTGKVLEKVKRMLESEEEELNKTVEKGATEVAKGIDVAITKISKVIEKLKRVIELLKQTNASSVAISAIEMTISHLNSVIEHLKDVKAHIKEIVKRRRGIKLPKLPLGESPEEVKKSKEKLRKFLERVEEIIENVEEFIEKAYERIPEDLKPKLDEIYNRFLELKDKLLAELEKEEVNMTTIMKLLREINSLRGEVMKLLRRKIVKPRITLITKSFLMVKSGEEFDLEIKVVNLANVTANVTVQVIDKETGEVLKEVTVALEAFESTEIEVSLKAPEVNATTTWKLKVVCYYSGEEIASKDVTVKIVVVGGHHTHRHSGEHEKGE